MSKFSVIKIAESNPGPTDLMEDMDLEESYSTS